MEMYPEEGWEYTPLPSNKNKENEEDHVPYCVIGDFDPYVEYASDDYDYSDCLVDANWWRSIENIDDNNLSVNGICEEEMKWNYSEGATLALLEDYLRGTYGAHYANEGSKIQTLDFIESIGDAEAFCRSNAIKYLSRFGKKDGKNPKDLLKVMHYAILLYHFSGMHDG